MIYRLLNNPRTCTICAVLWVVGVVLSGNTPLSGQQGFTPGFTPVPNMSKPLPFHGPTLPPDPWCFEADCGDPCYASCGCMFCWCYLCCGTGVGCSDNDLTNHPQAVPPIGLFMLKLSLRHEATMGEKRFDAMGLPFRIRTAREVAAMEKGGTCKAVPKP